MLMEMSVLEQRYQAVLAVLSDGETVTDVAARFGVRGNPVSAEPAAQDLGGTTPSAEVSGVAGDELSARLTGRASQAVSRHPQRVGVPVYTCAWSGPAQFGNPSNPAGEPHNE